MKLIYGKEFEALIILALIMAIAFTVHGFGDYINKYIGSQGMVFFTRNTAFMVGLTNILGFFFLIRWFGVEAAVRTKLLSSVVYLSGMLLYYYRKTMTNREKYRFDDFTLRNYERLLNIAQKMDTKFCEDFEVI